MTDTRLIDRLLPDPYTVPPANPRIIDELMRRDTWTRHEALLILAGYQPHSVTEQQGGWWVVGPFYLDGIDYDMLSRKGISHPREPDATAEYQSLCRYSQGAELSERRTPAQWLEWAEGKGFTPYWMADHPKVKQLREERERERTNQGAYILLRFASKFGHFVSTNWTSNQWAEVISQVTIRPETMLTIGDAARFVGHKHGLHDGAIKTLLNQIMAAAGKAFSVRHPHTDMPISEPERIRDYYDLVRADDLDAWFKSQGAEYRIQSEPGNMSALEAETSRTGGGEDAERTGPDAVPLQSILAVSWPLPNGYDMDDLRRNMSEAGRRKWIGAARIAAGTKGRGGTPSTWKPGKLAAALVEQKHADQKAMRRFLSRSFPDFLAEFDAAIPAESLDAAWGE